MYVWSEAVWPPHLTLLLLVLMLSTVHVRAGLSVRLNASMGAIFPGSGVVLKMVPVKIRPVLSCIEESVVIVFDVFRIDGLWLEVVVSSINLNRQVDAQISFNHL